MNEAFKKWWDEEGQKLFYNTSRVKSSHLAAFEAATPRWQPIETAPKDGSEMLVKYESGEVYLVRFISPCEFLTEDEGKDFDLDDWHESDWFYADFCHGGRCNSDMGKALSWKPTS